MRVIDYLFYFFPQKKNKPPLTREEEADPRDFFIRATPFCFPLTERKKQLQQEKLAWRFISSDI